MSSKIKVLKHEKKVNLLSKENIPFGSVAYHRQEVYMLVNLAPSGIHFISLDNGGHMPYDNAPKDGWEVLRGVELHINV